MAIKIIQEAAQEVFAAPVATIPLVITATIQVPKTYLDDVEAGSQVVTSAIGQLADNLHGGVVSVEIK